MSVSKRLARLERATPRLEPDEALRQRLNRALARLGLPEEPGPVYRTTCPFLALMRAEARHAL